MSYYLKFRAMNWNLTRSRYAIKAMRRQNSFMFLSLHVHVFVSVLEMLTGAHPWADDTSFDHSNPIAVTYSISNSNITPRIPDHISREAKEFLNSCFNLNPRRRPGASSLLLQSFTNPSSNNRKTVQNPAVGDDLHQFHIFLAMDLISTFSNVSHDEVCVLDI